MWTTLPLILVAPPTVPVPVALVPHRVDATDDAIAAAGKDPSKLVELGLGWLESGDEAGAQRAFEAAIAIDTDHEGAREALGHHRYEGKWYTTYAELSKAMRDEAERRLREDGTVRFRDGWVPKDELPFHLMEWEKLDDGSWGPPGSIDRLDLDEEREEQGWQRQHMTWIPPEEFDEWRSGKFKVGEDWLSAADADKAHAEIGKWWEVPGEHFIALTTVPEEQSRWVVWWADQTHADLVRMFGLEPKSKPELVVLNGIAQYNDFAAGNPQAGRAPADVNGHSSLHYAFFTDGWIEQPQGANVGVFRGVGAGYYDPVDPNLKPFGQHAVRHAAALSYLESVDPSWHTVSRMLTSPAAGFPDRSFWGEKRIPRWLRFGAAAYCERFFEDKNVGEGGDPLWARKWAKQNLIKDGQLDTVEDILALEFDNNDAPGSVRRIHEAGLLVHFILDGGDKKVDKAWSEYRDALLSGGDMAEPIAALEEALKKAEKKFAGFANS